VSRDVLVDRLRGQHPPAGAQHTLEVYVSRLRKTVPPPPSGSKKPSATRGCHKALNVSLCASNSDRWLLCRAVLGRLHARLLAEVSPRQRSGHRVRPRAR
jgi:hypothetical protein